MLPFGVFAGAAKDEAVALAQTGPISSGVAARRFGGYSRGMDLSWAESFRVRPFKRVEYDRLVELGVFGNERVELLGGMIVEMSPQGSEHNGVTRRLNVFFARALGDRVEVQSQGPLALAVDSEPEPDIALVPKTGLDRNPDTAFLVIEVSDSSLAGDRGAKAILYAKAGIPEYWIVNLVDKVFEIHLDPSADGYATKRVVSPSATIAPKAFPDAVVDIAAIFR